MSQLDRMKQAASRKPVGKPFAPKPNPSKPGKPGKPPRKKDPADRPEYAGLPKVPCPDCGFDHPIPVDKVHHDRLHCKKPWPAQPKGKIAKLDRKMMTKGRLPDGSQFVLQYSAVAIRWIGMLTVYVNEDVKEFRAENSAVHRLLCQLDDQYRLWLIEQTDPKTP